METYDYINQVNASVVDLQGYVDHTLPFSLLCITMILRVRRNFFEITTFPNRIPPPHAVVLTELFPNTLLDRSPGIVIELNVC